MTSLEGKDERVGVSLTGGSSHTSPEQAVRTGLVARDGKPGCPETVWDGPGSFRCSRGTDVCGRHGAFPVTGGTPHTSPEQGFHLTLSGLEDAVDAARDHGGYRPWNEMAVAVHAAFTEAGARIPSLQTLLRETEGRKWFR